LNNKVSIIIACYNKAQYIGALLESVNNQLWNNIEVIIINDGSTDDSNKIIIEWEKKFLERGFDIVIVHQENLGVAAAIKIGLRLARGEYVCFPDADDELPQNFVSEMMNTLNNNDNADFAVCDIGRRNEKNGEINIDFLDENSFKKGKTLEKYLLQKFDISICRYVFKLSYLNNVGLPDSIVVSPKSTQEPQIMIPVLNGNGRCVKSNQTLYIYNSFVNGLASVQKKNPVDMILGEYHEIQLKTIAKLPISESRKFELMRIAGLGNIILCNKLLHRNFISENFIIAITKKILKEEIPKFIIPTRVIAYGSLGRVAMKLLPEIKDTPLWPTLFWDKGATDNSSTFDGSKITIIRPELIQKGDLILCFPKNKQILIEAQILADINEASVMPSNKINEWLIDWHLSFLFDNVKN